MEKEEVIFGIFCWNNGYVKIGEIFKVGFYNYYFDLLLEKGVIIKFKWGLYCFILVSVDSELEEVCWIVLKGVVCFFFVWDYYGFLDFVFFEYYIVIEKF